MAEGAELGFPAAVRAVSAEHGLCAGAAAASLARPQVSASRLPTLLSSSSAGVAPHTLPLGSYLGNLGLAYIHLIRPAHTREDLGHLPAALKHIP